MNNYELSTDEFCTKYRRYRKRFSWKAFKKFGYVKGQVLCEKYDIILTDYKTRRERYNEGFDKTVSFLKKYAVKAAKSSGGKKVKIFPDEKPRKLDIFPSTRRDFDEINNRLFGKKKSIF